MQGKRWIPWSLVALRTALGPVLIHGEQCRWNGATLAGMVLAALLSDIYDGVLARKWKTDTAVLRLSDTLADTLFYLCVFAAVLLSLPQVWHTYRAGLLTLLGCELFRFGFDIAKFGKPASYHAYSAKLWRLVLAIAVILLFATQHASPWLTAAIALGFINNAESFAMSLLLPRWQRDVKTLAVAWRLRSTLHQEGTGLRKSLAALAFVAVLLLGSSRGSAETLHEITYVHGTAIDGQDLNGNLSLSSPDRLTFDGSAHVVIAYDHIVTYQSCTRKKVRVGLLTEAVWRLLAPWPVAKQVTISYRDQESHPQTIVFEMSSAQDALLLKVLQARAAPAAGSPLRLPAH